MMLQAVLPRLFTLSEVCQRLPLELSQHKNSLFLLRSLYSLKYGSLLVSFSFCLKYCLVSWPQNSNNQRKNSSLGPDVNELGNFGKWIDFPKDIRIRVKIHNPQPVIQTLSRRLPG